MNPEVRRIERLAAPMLRPLLLEGRAEGFGFLDRLLEEYETGVNRFDRPGEALFGVFEGMGLVAIGGLNIDPFAGDSSIGRVRRLYVRPSFRRLGIGRLLMTEIIAEARPHFTRLALRTNTAQGAAFYESLGFRTEPSLPEATHLLSLNRDQDLDVSDTSSK